MPSLAFDQICKSYGDVVACSDVTFEVREGEVFGLLGPNGAGKTTLIRILMDIIRPNSGRILYEGRPLRRADLDSFGYLPEERGLYRKQKVLAVMAYFGSLKGLSRVEARQRSIQWLERIDLAHVAGWRVERLSKGMSQKVQIAATLLTEPQLCVLDEPFSGLDPVNIQLVEDLISQRRERRLTTILSTHQMNMVETLCDRVAMINGGRLMIYDSVENVRRNYSPSEVRVDLAGELPQLSGVKQVISSSNGSFRLVLDGQTEPSTVLEQLVRARAKVERFESVLAPMQDVFIKVVQAGKQPQLPERSELHDGVTR